MTRVIGLMFLALLVVALPHGAFAANDVFTVRSVAVDATSDGAAEARDIAIAQGQRTAFQRLLKRLTRRDDWGRLPDAGAVQLTNLVLGYQVVGERTSTTHYIANVTFSFKPAAIRALLRGAGIGFSETRSRPVLVLPVYESPGQIVLFEEPNPWKAAWARQDLADGLVPVLLPSSDLEDSRSITAAQAKTAGWSEVAGLAQKYGVERVMIADAAVGTSGNLAVKTRIVSSAADSASQTSFAGPDMNAAFDQAVDASLSRISETWKVATITSAGERNELVASVPFSSLQEWLSIRRRLTQIPTLSSFDVLALSTQGAEVKLGFSGTPEQLGITLDQISLKLAHLGSYWQITGAGAGAQTGALPPTSGTVIGSVGDTVPMRGTDARQ